MLPFTLRLVIFNNNGTDTIKVYTNNDLQLTVTDHDSLPGGGVARLRRGRPASLPALRLRSATGGQF